MLYREPKLLKATPATAKQRGKFPVSVLYREPKLLKDDDFSRRYGRVEGFSALP